MERFFLCPAVTGGNNPEGMCNRSVTLSHRPVTAESRDDNNPVTATPATGVLNGVTVTMW